MLLQIGALYNFDELDQATLYDVELNYQNKIFSFLELI